MTANNISDIKLNDQELNIKMRWAHVSKRWLESFSEIEYTAMTQPGGWDGEDAYLHTLSEKEVDAYFKMRWVVIENMRDWIGIKLMRHPIDSKSYSIESALDLIHRSGTGMLRLFANLDLQREKDRFDALKTIISEHYAGKCTLQIRFQLLVKKDLNLYRRTLFADEKSIIDLINTIRTIDCKTSEKEMELRTWIEQARLLRTLADECLIPAIMKGGDILQQVTEVLSDVTL